VFGTRLPTVWGGRPARAASSPGGGSLKATDWEEGVGDRPGGFKNVWCSALASPPCGEVGQLAQRARRVGGSLKATDWEEAVGAALGGFQARFWC